MPEPAKKSIPVTVLSGFLGSGKTTILNNVLNQPHGLRLAVIVNDMSEVNIDAAIVKDASTPVLRAEEQLVEMSNGCICCTLREDLLREVAKLAQNKELDGIIIESTGVSEPLPVAETFTFESETGERLMDHARLDTLVTAVDAANFIDTFSSGDTLADRAAGVDSSDERGLAQLLTDQIEFATVIVLTKKDLVEPQQLSQIRALIQELNPRARVLEIEKGAIPIREIFDTKAFSLEMAEQHKNWLAEPRGSHTPETAEYGISSFVFQAQRPFDHARLMTLLRSNRLARVIRSKGFVWTTKDPSIALYWSHAGKLMNLEPHGHWEQQDGAILGEQSLVLIGIDMDEQQIRRELEAALAD